MLGLVKEQWNRQYYLRSFIALGVREISPGAVQVTEEDVITVMMLVLYVVRF